MLNVTNERGVLRYSGNLNISITKMWTGPKTSHPAGPYTLQSISKTSDKVSIAHRPCCFLIFDEKVPAIKLDVVDKTHTITPF